MQLVSSKIILILGYFSRWLKKKEKKRTKSNSLQIGRMKILPGAQQKRIFLFSMLHLSSERHFSSELTSCQALSDQERGIVCSEH